MHWNWETARRFPIYGSFFGDLWFAKPRFPSSGSGAGGLNFQLWAAAAAVKWTAYFSRHHPDHEGCDQACRERGGRRAGPQAHSQAGGIAAHEGHKKSASLEEADSIDIVRNRGQRGGVWRRSGPAHDCCLCRCRARSGCDRVAIDLSDSGTLLRHLVRGLARRVPVGWLDREHGSHRLGRTTH